DDDWNDVRMVLVSGRPISYQMNLYEPLYLPRPMVEPELFASLRPPVYGGSMYGDEKGPAGKQPALAPGQPPAGVSGVINPQYQGQLQFGLQQPMGQFGINGVTPFVNQGQLGLQGTPQQQLFNLNPYQKQNTTNNFNYDMNKLTFDELQQRRQKLQEAADKAKKAGTTIAGLNFKEGIASVASAEEIGDYYQYVLDQKITLPRQKSAMLPIIDHTIEGAKISIFNETIHAKFPLLGLRLKNTSGQPLTQGPITVYEEGSYAGDTRILDLQPDEASLLSYTLDQGTEVKTEVKESPNPDLNFKIGEAQLTAKFKLRQTRTYTIKNRSVHDRVIVLEHPIRTEWKLVEPAKASEKTRSVYRFQVLVPAGKTVQQQVVEEQARTDQFALLTGKDVKPHYAVGLGIEVKQITQAQPEKLHALKIVKGIVIPTQKVRESKTYFVQNLSEQARNFTVDHIVRPDWVRLDPQGDSQRGPGVFRFTLEVPAGKTANKEVLEERTFPEKGKSVKELTETKIREYLGSPVPSAEVKAGLSKALALNLVLTESQRKLAELEKQLKSLSDDQARLRENLRIIPQTSEAYKQFLEKFVLQESQIDTYQKQIRDLQVSVQTQQKEYELFVSNLTAD